MNLIRLKEDKDSIFLLCEDCIASKAMHSRPGIVDFEETDLYSWLNGEFAEKYLSAEERSRLLEVTLLSATEAAFFFPEEEKRGCRPGPDAVAENIRIGGNGNVWWWLRDKGSAGDFYQIVDFAGHVCSQGTYETLKTNGVRPVIRLRKR